MRPIGGRETKITQLAVQFAALSTAELRQRLAHTKGAQRTPDMRNLVAALRRVLKLRETSAARHKLVQDQRDWINSRGGSLAGYVERYGPKVCDVCAGRGCAGCANGVYTYGDGGPAIYKADTDALADLERTGRRRSPKVPS